MIYVSIFFANRLVNIWNSLHSYVVSAETVNCFKTRLDRFWLNQDIIYNFRSKIHGTGSRSELTAGSLEIFLNSLTYSNIFIRAA